MSAAIVRDVHGRGLQVVAPGDSTRLYGRIFHQNVSDASNISAQDLARNTIRCFLPDQLDSTTAYSMLFSPQPADKPPMDDIYMDLDVALGLVRGPITTTTAVTGEWPYSTRTGPRTYRFVVQKPVEVAEWAIQAKLVVFLGSSTERFAIQGMTLADLSDRQVSNASLTRAITGGNFPSSRLIAMDSPDSVNRSIAWARLLGLGMTGDSVWVSVPRAVLFPEPSPECVWAPMDLHSLRPKPPGSWTSMKIDAAEGSLEYVRYYFTDSEGQVVQDPQQAEGIELIGHTGCEEAVCRAIVRGAAIWALDSGSPKNRHSKRYYIGSWKDFADIVTKAMSKPSFGFFARIENSSGYEFEDVRGHAYEVVLGERMTAVYMDIDGYLDTNPEFLDENKREELVWAVIRTHLRMLQRVYGRDGLPKDLNEKDYHIYDSSSQDTDTAGGKMSFHIILKRVFFANNVEQAEFMKKFHHYLVEVADRVRRDPAAATVEDLEAAKIVGHGKDGYSDSLIDFSVYKTEKVGQLWRGCHSSKAPEQPFGKSRVLRVASFNHAPFEDDTDAGQVLTSMVQRPPYGDYEKIDFVAAAPSDVEFVRKIPQHAFLTDEERRQLGVTNVNSLKRKAPDSEEDQEHSPKRPANQSTGSFTRVSPHVEELFRQFLVNWRSAEPWRETLSRHDGCHVKKSNDQPPSFIIDLKGKNQPCILRALTEDECKRAPGQQGSTIHSNALVYFIMNYNKYEEKWQIVQSCMGQCKSILQAGDHSCRAVLGNVPDEFMDEVLDGWRGQNE